MADKQISRIAISQKLGFIGGGNMARAICDGLINTGRAQYSQIYVSGPHIERLNTWKKNGVYVTLKNGEIVDQADVIFLTVKPQFLAEAIADALATCSSDKTSNKLFISVLAGVELSALEKTLDSFNGARVIRVMPNIALTVSEGCVTLCPGQFATEDDISLVRSIFEVSGLCNIVPESMIDAIGALTGSGPAFVFAVIEALSDGAVKMGIPREMSTRLAAQTVLGSAKMVLDTGLHTGVLKDQVCSPGGITIAGVHALERGGLRSALMDAVETATLKNKDLGRHCNNFLKKMSSPREQFEEFKKKFDKKYETAEEEERRFVIFQANLEKISKHNEDYEKKLVTWSMGVNQFTDMEAHEMHCGVRKASGSCDKV